MCSYLSIYSSKLIYTYLSIKACSYLFKIVHTYLSKFIYIYQNFFFVQFYLSFFLPFYPCWFIPIYLSLFISIYLSWSLTFSSLLQYIIPNLYNNNNNIIDCTLFRSLTQTLRWYDFLLAYPSLASCQWFIQKCGLGYYKEVNDKRPEPLLPKRISDKTLTVYVAFHSTFSCFYFHDSQCCDPISSIRTCLIADGPRDWNQVKLVWPNKIFSWNHSWFLLGATFINFLLILRISPRQLLQGIHSFIHSIHSSFSFSFSFSVINFLTFFRHGFYFFFLHIR